MLGVLNGQDSMFTFAEKPSDEGDSRIYSVQVKKKCDTNDKTDDYGDNVHRSWNDDEGTIIFHTEWEGKVGEAEPSDLKIKKLVYRMSHETAIIELQVMDEKSLCFLSNVVLSTSPELLKIQLPIDQAISGNEIHKFINAKKGFPAMLQPAIRIAITLIFEDTSNYKSENVRDFLLDITPVNELFIAIKRGRKEKEYDQQTTIIDKEFFETLITKKKHNHVAVEYALGVDFITTLVNRVTETMSGMPDWNSVEFNIEYPLLEMFMRHINIAVEISDGKLRFTNFDNNIDSESTSINEHYEGYLYIPERQLHCFFFRGDSGGMGVYVGPEVHGDSRQLDKGVFTLRIDKNVPEHWTCKDFVKTTKTA